jgi:hypothetical protein
MTTFPNIAALRHEIAQHEHDANNVDAFNAFERRAAREHAAALRDELDDAIAQLRTPDVAAVLDAVRTTGKSAHPQRGERVSDLVYAVAITNNVNPVALQHDVEQYADALDA